MANFSDCFQDLIWANGILHIWDNGAFLEFYDGPIPANPNLGPADTNVCLLRMMLPNNPFRMVTPNLVDVNATWESMSGDAINLGTATWARLRKIEDPNTTEIPNRFPRMDMTVGIALPSELVLDVDLIDFNTVIRVHNFTFNRMYLPDYNPQIRADVAHALIDDLGVDVAALILPPGYFPPLPPPTTTTPPPTTTTPPPTTTEPPTTTTEPPTTTTEPPTTTTEPPTTTTV